MHRDSSVSPTWITAEARIAAARLTRHDLRELIRLIGPVDRSEWECSRVQGSWQVVKAKGVKWNLSVRVARNYCASSLHRLIHFGPWGVLNYLRGSFHQGSSVITLTVGSPKRFVRKTTLRYEGPGEDLPEHFQAVVSQFMADRRIRGIRRTIAGLVWLAAPFIALAAALVYSVLHPPEKTTGGMQMAIGAWTVLWFATAIVASSLMTSSVNLKSGYRVATNMRRFRDWLGGVWSRARKRDTVTVATVIAALAALIDLIFK